MSNLIQPDGTPVESTEAAEKAEAVINEGDAALDKLVELSGGDFDRGQANLLKEKLAKLRAATEGQDVEAALAEVNTAKPVPTEQQRALTGKDVDWSAYNLDFNVKHLYPRAVYKMTQEGPKWVVVVVEFFSTTKDFKQYETLVNKPGTKDKEAQEYLNLGRYLQDKINGPEEWQIESLMPAQSGQVGLLLTRKVVIALPDPQPLKTEETVEPAQETELQAVEDAALAFAADEGLIALEQLEIPLDEAVAVEDNTSTPSVGLRAIEKGTVEYEQARAQLDEKGALQSRTGALASQAIQTASAETIEAPQADYVTPPPVGNPLIGGAPNVAAGYDAAQEVLRALGKIE